MPSPPKYSALAYLTIVLSLALILPVLLLLAGNSPAAATSPSALVPTPLEGEQEITPTQHEVAFGQLPLYFIENQGQLDDRVAYYIQGHDKTLYFTQEGITFALSPSLVAEPVLSEVEGEGQGGGFSPSSSEGEGWGGGRYILKLDFLNANPRVRPIGQQPTEAVISYFKGPNDQWHTGLPTYAKLVYPNLWPGIDLVYSGAANRLKYEFVVKPGADPAQIRLAYRGATAVWVNHAGQLEVSTPTGSFHDDTPYAYQEIDGQQIAIPAAYTLDSNPALLPPRSPAPLHAYGFHLSDYDPTQPLIIDPAMLVYAGFVGGSGDDRGQDIAVDSAGSVYITGFTDSPQATFPETVGPDLTYNSGIYDAFVAKINPAGTALVYAGYIGGSGNDDGYGIAVDDTGSAYITGLTDSAETQGFPVIAGPDLTYNGDISPDPRGDAFIAKVNPSGTALLYAGYIGGSMAEVGFGIALDSSNQAYVVGLTNSRENSSPNPFPVAVGPDLTHNDPGVIGDSFDAFIVKVTANGSGFNYAGYIGGSADDRGYDVAVDSAGNAYVSGETQSDQATFPTSIGPDLTHNGGRDAFVAKVNPSGAGLVYAGYLGGGNDDAGSSIVVDSAEAAYLAGETYSDQTTFPETVESDLTFGEYEMLLRPIRPDGSGLDYAGYIGGSGDETGRGVAIDSAGNAYVTGYTASADFPASVGPDLSHNGGLDVFIAKLNTAGSGFSYAGFIGGSGNDDGWEIAVDNAGSAYLTGQTDSTETSFPETGGLDLSYNGGILDAFVAKITSNVRVTATGPVSNALNITPTANVTATFSDDITPTTITSRTFVVHGDLTGRYTQTLSYSAPSRTVTLNPPGAFKPGEVMMVSAASGISSTTGISLTPYVWQFWAAATGGSGNFVPHPTTPNFDSGNNTTDSTDVALGDIDGDGDLDAIIANANASTQAETVWRNDGLGNFTPHPTVPSFGSDQSSEVVLGDLDGDGDLDAVVSNYDNQPETTWLNNGTGVFTQHLTIPSFSSGSYSSGIGVGDVNSDGYLDVVVANYNGQGETVWLNNGTGGFTQHPTTPNFGVGSNSGDVVLGDLNGDGTLDAIVANRLNEAETVWLNDGRGNFTPHSPASFGAGDSFTVALGDINGDGDLDALVANQGQTETVWMNDGAGVFTNSSSFDAGSDSTDVALGDIDGDGDLDAVIANAFNQTETVWINNGTGSFSAHPTIPSFGTGDSQAVALGDIDGDGDLDVLIANYSSQAETVWLNQNPANLAITKTDSPDPVSAGATLTYTLRITNTGPTTATYLLVTDTLPSGVAFVSISGAGWNCGQGGGVVTCTRPSLGVGAAPTIVITTTAPIAAGVITNTATVTGAVIDAVMGNNTVTVTTTVSPVTTLVVNSANDADDGTCNVTHCSLREAINAANALPGSQTITFNIPGVGPHTISPNSALPYITDPVTIDGSTQPGASCASWPPTLRIELNGSNAGPGAVGLVIFAGNSVIRGL
ncbi:MAG: FG-GAP-like repeat-containing protein, partial [Anaerolineae bacterium]